MLLLRVTKRNPLSSILDLQIHSEPLEEHVRVDLSKFQRFRKRLSLFVSLFRSHYDVKDLLFHHLLLIARHYIYTCRLGNKLPKLQVYIQVPMNSIEIEKQIAFHNNDSNVFVRKWSRF